ncbi:unnamed protein product [Soboliphyme baturini]|uniref:WD_REPEATS_REGION domain-containing protein n=1 Tax=Soboliphyme baturini TaxID=241478 RepID=A0A183J0M1_9BILA|nr:unnamed protein product [Soboliphyme baturini]
MLLSSNGLVIPVVVWGKEPISHRITSVCALLHTRIVVTGSEEGFICVWKFDEEYKLQPVLLLAGHDGAVLALCKAHQKSEGDEFFSSDQNGNLLLWNSSDGRCVQSSTSRYVHTQLSVQAVDFGESVSEFLFCAGRYSEIVAISPKNLQVLVRFASRVEPDWISAFCLFGTKQKSDVIIGVTVAGLVKIWSLQNVAENVSMTLIIK